MKRKDILRFANYTCEKCKRRFPPEALEIHHPANSNEPIQVLCRSCHKRAVTRKTKREVPDATIKKFLKVIYEKSPEFDLLSVTEKIGTLVQLFPKLRPRVIAKICGTTPNTVRVKLYQIRKSL